jgi:DNA processing protein
LPGTRQCGSAAFSCLAHERRGRRRKVVMSAVLDFVALSLLPERCAREAAAGLRAGEPPDSLLERIVRATPKRGRRSVAALRASAATAVISAEAKQITPIVWTDPDYPAPLAAIVDPPPTLWLMGDRDALLQPMVAIVGSRAGSVYALAVADRLAADLVAHGLIVVSGLARGVDAAAHRGALSAGGRTVGVLGSGLDVIYPPEHHALAREMIARSGAVISEVLPGTPPLPQFFPRRNRIISGLARAVVIVEAGEKSGSLITARCALEQGREVLAVPGSILTGRNRGGHALLRDGAKIVEGVDDILEELGYAVTNPDGQDGTSKGQPVESDPILACLTAGEPSDLDAIAEKTGLQTARLLPRLFELELRGLVRRAGGGRFVRFDRSC